MKIENCSSTEISRGIHKLYEHFSKNIFNIYTVDRGKEFACGSKVEADLKVSVYFASWCRGSNENANDLLQEFFLKKIDLARVSDEEIRKILSLINHRPRKGIGWKIAWVTYPRSGIPESSYFMNKCRICTDNSSHKKIGTFQIPIFLFYLVKKLLNFL